MAEAPTPRADLAPAPWLSPRAERLADRAALVACALFTLAMLWELWGPLPGGHLGNVAGSAICGENMLRWRIFACVPDYIAQPPQPSQFYAHHPYGVFLAHALARAIFGHGWATTRLPAVVCSAVSAVLLHRLARSLWGPVPAAVAAWTFVLVPINLAFGQFASLEVLTIAFGLLFSWATARFFSTWQSRYIVAASVGALGAAQSDWVGLVLVGTAGLFAFARAYALPRRLFGHVDDRQHALWFAWVTAAAVGSLLLYLALFGKAGRLGDLLSSYQGRTSGADAPLRQIFGPRRVMWIVWMLPPAALASIALGLIAHPVRLVARARIEESLPLAWLAAATFQYLGFRQAADVHIFWPHYYGVVAPLSAGALASCALALASSVRNRFRLVSPGQTAALASLSLAPFALGALSLARVAPGLLYQSRLTGGRFDDGGRYIAVDQDRAVFARWASPRLPPEGALSHRSFPPNWNVEYGLLRPLHDGGAQLGRAAPADPLRFSLLDARMMTPGELREAARNHALELWGPFALVDRSRPAAPPRALAFVEHQPSLFERYFVTGSDLIRSVGPDDPFATWEWREHLGYDEPPPSLEPRTAAEARVAFNAGVARGLPPEALAPLRERALSATSRRLDLAFTGDVRLVGLDVDEGAATVVTLLWQTGPGFTPIDADFLVRSKIVAPPPLWASAVDYFEKEVAPPTALRPGLWKPGRLYVQRFVAMRRAGRERFYGYWVARGASPMHPVDGREPVELFLLP